MNILERIYNLLQPDERGKVIKMATSVFFMAVLDFVSLAMLLPVLYFLLEENGEKEAALFCGLLAIVVILLKYVISTLLLRYQNQSLLTFYKRLSFSMFSTYYNRGLLFIRSKGNSSLSYDINAVCYSFSHSLLSPLCRMAGDILLVLLFTVALVIWGGASVMLLYVAFIPFVCFYVFVVRGRVRKYGIDDMRVKREQTKIVSEALRGYVDIEVNRAFPLFQRSFIEGMDRVSHNRMKLDGLLRLPFFLSELSVVVSLVLLVISGGEDVKMLVGVFAIAAFRLLPAMKNILTSWTQVQNSVYCLDVIEAGLSDDKSGVDREELCITFEKEISVEGVSYVYPDGRRAIDNVDIRVLKGEYVGLCGRSGGGKSTLFNIMSALLKPTSGSIKIDGVPLTDATRASWIEQIAYVPQEVFIFGGTLAENIALGSSDADGERVNEIIGRVGLDAWVEALPSGVNTHLVEMGSELSGGQKQRIGIARALYKGASVLLLDESTSALDDASEREINKTLYSIKEKDKNLTILSIAHRKSSLEYCDRIITIGEDYE